MARANLSIDSSILDAFTLAQENLDVRFLKVSIQNESLHLNSTILAHESIESDFDILLNQHLSETEASLILFRLNSQSSTNSWLLLAWVPDNCRVRDKMLYSSSRDDLKRSLGIGYFSSEYAANLLSDVNWRSLQEYLNREHGKVFSEVEIRLTEEKSLSHKESSKVKTAALGAIPFKVSAETAQCFADFSNSLYNWVELTVANESIELISSQNISDLSNLTPHINADEARFYLAKLNGEASSITTFFIFSCPESTPVKMKMTMSSSKVSVISAAKEYGLTFTKTFEIREPEEINDTVKMELFPTRDSEFEASSASARISFSKPQRPGRSARATPKLNKFVEDV